MMDTLKFFSFLRSVNSKSEEVSSEEPFGENAGMDDNSEGCCGLKPRLKQVGTDGKFTSFIKTIEK